MGLALRKRVRVPETSGDVGTENKRVWEMSSVSWSPSPGKIIAEPAWGAVKVSRKNLYTFGSQPWAPVLSLSLFARGPRESHLLRLSFLLAWLEITTSILPECHEQTRVLTAAISVWVSADSQKEFESLLTATLITYPSVLLLVSWSGICDPVPVRYIISWRITVPHKSLLSVYQAHINHSGIP